MKPFLQSCPRRGGPVLKDENVPGAVRGEGSYHCPGARRENCASFVGVMAWGSGMGLPYGRAMRRGCRYTKQVTRRDTGEKRPQDCPKESSRSELGRKEGGVGRGEK